MPKQVRLRRGTTAQHATFTGAEGEVTFDTTKKCLVVHDGVTPGGRPFGDYLVLSPVDVEAQQVINSKVRIAGGFEDFAFEVDNFTQLNNVNVKGTLDVSQLNGRLYLMPTGTSSIPPLTPHPTR